MSELNKAIEDLAKSWSDFQTADRDSKSRSEAERKEMLAKVNDAVTAASDAKKAADEAILKANRIAVSGGDTKGERPEDAEHKKAYMDFIRKGVDAGLGDIERKALSIGTSADGGYALPKQLADQVQAKMVDISPIRSLATVVQTSSNDYRRIFDVRGTASGWVGETAARTATNTPQLAELPAFMGDLYANATASQWSLDDIFFNAEGWLTDSIATEFARAQGAAFVSGSGTNQPKGFTAYTTAATADSGRAFGTIEHVATGVAGDFAASNKGDTLVSIVYKLKAAHRAGATWVTNKAILGEIRAFKEATTNAYMWQPGLAAGQPDRLLGYPIVESEDMPAKAANALGIAFGNFRNGYCVVDRVGVRALRDPYTNKPNVQFYVTQRVGGMLLDSEAIKVVKFSVS